MSSQSSKPSRRKPLRAIYVDNTPAPTEAPAEPPKTLEPNVSEHSNQSQLPTNESPPNESPPRKSACESVSTTPLRRSSGQRPYTTCMTQAARSIASSGLSRHTASHTRSHTSRIANPPPTKQAEIEKQIDMEMEDAVFLDDDFVQNFLSGDSERLDWVLDYCKSAPAYAGGWSFPKEGQESTLYEPIVEILNTIKRAVETGDQTDNGDPTNNQPELASPRFLNYSASGIPADDADSTNVKPDIVLFEGQHRHWETVRMAIEVKGKPNQLKEGMKQLSRYARVMYAHQLHRRHLYGLVVCGPKVTFVRYDRAGIIHSPEIDMCESFGVFTKAFASLLMLGRQAEGYDPAFSTTINESGRLDYYVDLPESAFDQAPAEPCVAGPSRSAASEGGTGSGRRILPTRRFKVVERLCHRKSIRGRATIVLRIREVVESDEPVDKGKGQESAEGNTKKRKVDEMDEQQRLHYILKLIWRDPLRESEGDVMEILRGMFALAQHVWHSDVAGECKCGMDGACGTCVDETPRPKNLKPSPVMGFKRATSAEGCATQSISVADTITNTSDGCVRKYRIYSRILMSSVGEPLWVANSVEEFLRALLDAILGYWRLVNLGILHRDISDGNVMLLRGAQNYPRRQWLEERAEDVETLRGQFGDMAESESELRKILNSLNRDPSGMLSDFDLHTKHRRAPTTTRTDDVLPSTGVPLLGLGVSSTSQIVHDQDSGLPSKRLKTNSSTSVPVVTPIYDSDSDEELDRVSALYDKRKPRGTRTSNQRRPLIDFRTGTPTFMSVGVLGTAPGVSCPHTFMDDLESFFWLLFWSVAAHLNPNTKSASPIAQETLHMLDNDHMETISAFKIKILRECSIGQGDDIIDRLQSFENDWADNRSVGWLILKMGSYFSAHADAKNRPPPEPVAAFPKIVNMIMKALTPRRA
ncbi:hypothetical protein BDV93DRAFT_608423 [Ceratobasidium sp. AG-I]|nr:hypothetical protein BDV93DRAFT_608423 [Ceratobasidium sp. AG-I]